MGIKSIMIPSVFNIQKLGLLQNTQALVTSASYFLILLLLNNVSQGAGHIGQPCQIFGICWPPNIHIYCDESRICRCRPETPVIVGPHQCKRNKSHGDKCSSDQECLYSDNYSFCDSNLCNCVQNYTYDPFLMKCVHASMQQRSSFNVLYTMLSSAALWMILLLITLFISIPCCLAFLYHCVCYEPPNSETTICRDSSLRLRFAESAGSSGTGTGGGDGVRVSLRQDDLVSRQSSYELASYDEPPPTYEEACKHYQTAPILSHEDDSLDGFKNELPR